MLYVGLLLATLQGNLFLWTLERRPLRLRKAISINTKATFVEAQYAQMTPRLAV